MSMQSRLPTGAKPRQHGKRITSIARSAERRSRLKTGPPERQDMSVYDDIKKALQDLLAPDIREIKGELRAVNVRLDSIDRRFDDLIDRLGLEKRIANLEREKKENPTQ